MEKEKTPLIVFYRNGDDGTIGLEWGNDANESIQIEQQLIGAIECYLLQMKEDLVERIKVSNDETERKFT